MRKTFELKDLDCANCAAKMERAIEKMKEVNEVSVNYFTQKLIIDIDDGIFDETMKAVQEKIRRVEPDCRVIM